MEAIDHFRALRRRWPLIVLAAVLGAIAGWFTAPGDDRASTYEAVHLLLHEASEPSDAVDLAQATLLGTTGVVPDRVQERLGREPGDGAVTVIADPTRAVLAVRAESEDASRATALADATAEELTAEVASARTAAYEARLAGAGTEVERARDEVARLEFIGSDTNAELAAARTRLAEAFLRQQSLIGEGAPESPLRSLADAVATPADDGGIQAPDSRAGRAVLVGAFGLLLGIGAAFVLDRLDTRIHDKRAAEAAFGLPVLAVIPNMPRGERGKLVVATHPGSPFVESYRSLRTVVALWDPHREGEDKGDTGRVIVVTSPSASEGKTTSVAHLAALLAELGRSVLVVSGDLRRPQIHRYFGRQVSPGLTEALANDADSGSAMKQLDLRSNVRGVRILTSGEAVENPAPVVERTGRILTTAGRLCDFVLVDTPPLLVANDATQFAQRADGVVILARAGRTTVAAARAAMEALRLVDAPMIGVVLVAASTSEGGGYSYYRRNDYYRKSKRRRYKTAPLPPVPPRVGNGSNGHEPAEQPAGKASRRP